MQMPKKHEQFEQLKPGGVTSQDSIKSQINNEGSTEERKSDPGTDIQINVSKDFHNLQVNESKKKVRVKWCR